MPSNRLNTGSPSLEPKESAGLLSPTAYDDDASSIHSRSDQDTDSDDDELQLRARNSRELRAADATVLMDEDELHDLVTTSRKKQQQQGPGLSVPNPLNVFGRRSGPGASTEHLMPAEKEKERNKSRRSRRKERRHSRHGEDGQLMMQELEEGDAVKYDSDRHRRRRRSRLGLAPPRTTRRQCGGGRDWRRWAFIHVSMALVMTLVVLVAWNIIIRRRGTGAQSSSSPQRQQLVSNGTVLFAPTTIIISLDGFRADFMDRGLTPRLDAFVKEGVSPAFMTPSFPSLTFPNHYSLVTGLYPESHGIVGNSFWDPDLQAEFYYTDPARSLDAKWWRGEPVWESAENQGIRAAIHMWPGSEAPINGQFASIVDKYKGDETLDNKVTRILGLLDLPGGGGPQQQQEQQESSSPPLPHQDTNHQQQQQQLQQQRPQLIAAYVPNVDADGHKYGPNSTEIRATIRAVDAMLDGIFTGLEARNLTDIVNVIVVSDHGMATTDTSRLLQLEDLVDTSLIEHTDGWPLYGLRPKNASHTNNIYAQLRDKAMSNPNFDVYLRDVDMPPQYHFSNDRRIAPLWIVPKVGWAIVTADEMDVKAAQHDDSIVYHPRGLHGYDHRHPLMRAIFIARGPAFPHPPNSRIEPFQNINVYNILCDSLGIPPRPNNGTLRLPLTPIGTHDDDHPPSPARPVITSASIPDRPVITSASIPDRPVLSSVAIPHRPIITSISVPPRPELATPSPEEEPEEAEAGPQGWLDWLQGKANDLWDTIFGSA